MTPDTVLIIESGSGLPHHDDRLFRWSNRVAWALQPNFFYGSWRDAKPSDPEDEVSDGKWWGPKNDITGVTENWKTWYDEHVGPMLGRMRLLREANRPVVFHGGGWLINDHLPLDEQRARCQKLASDIKAAIPRGQFPLDGVLLDYEQNGKTAGAVYSLLSPIAKLAPWTANFNFSSAQTPRDRELSEMYWPGAVGEANGTGRAKGSRLWANAPQMYEYGWRSDRFARMFEYIRNKGKPLVPWLPVCYKSLDWHNKLTNFEEVWALNESAIRTAHSFGARAFVLAAYMLSRQGTPNAVDQLTVEEFITRADRLLIELDGKRI